VWGKRSRETTEVDGRRVNRRNPATANIALALGAKLVLAAGAVLGVVSLAVAVLVGDMGGSLAVTINALRLARMRADAQDPADQPNRDSATRPATHPSI
jgi:hypothetical protein